jgi:CheY-like chemotaxis protein
MGTAIALGSADPVCRLNLSSTFRSASCFSMTTPPIIIISEPDSMISDVLRVEFSRWEFAVLLAEGSAAADTYAGQIVASLVVLDASTAQLSAYEACARIRRRPGYADRPIVLTAREVSHRTTAAAEVAGATVLLPKPYSVMDLFRALTPHMQPNDPLLVAGGARTGMAAPSSREWAVPGSLEWRSGGDSALSRNKLLLPIVRGLGKKIPMLGKTS